MSHFVMGILIFVVLFLVSLLSPSRQLTGKDLVNSAADAMIVAVGVLFLLGG